MSDQTPHRGNETLFPALIRAKTANTTSPVDAPDGAGLGRTLSRPRGVDGHLLCDEVARIARLAMNCLPVVSLSQEERAARAWEQVTDFDRDARDERHTARMAMSLRLDGVADDISRSHGANYVECAHAVGLAIDAHRAMSTYHWPRAERFLWDLCSCLRAEKLVPNPMLQILVDAVLATRPRERCPGCRGRCQPYKLAGKIVAPSVEDCRQCNNTTFVAPSEAGSLAAIVEGARELIADGMHSHLAVAEVCASLARVPGAGKVDR